MSKFHLARSEEYNNMDVTLLYTGEVNCCFFINFITTVFQCTSSCWLSTENGVIWAFVAPMLAIITVSGSRNQTTWFL